MKRYFFLFLCLVAPFFTSVGQLSAPLPFLADFEPVAARITDYAFKDTLKAPAALIRLPNKKIAYMVRTAGGMSPFYIKAVETGYWDTRYEKDTDYNSVFRDMKDMGANTAYIMIHWEDIEPRDGTFDFSFTDSLVATAGKNDMKIVWILFLHAQERVPSLKPETAWTFHLDDRDTSNYTMQWVKRDGKVYTNIQGVLKHAVRPLHVYGHPEIFYRVRRMLYHLAVHYREDETVIGVQLGNEEGFSFIDDSDYNPVTRQLFDEWKCKTNKREYSQFKKEAMDWWWRQFTTAFHEGDPYKILSFNLDAAQAEAGDRRRMELTGTDAGTYADGNLDAIGTMLYKRWGYQALCGLDRRYGSSYNYKLPILIPSEIGIGTFNPLINFRHFVANTLERGGQGFGVYCYGEIRKELPERADERTAYIQMMNMINACEEIIYEGLPGAGKVKVSTPHEGIKVSHLSTDDNRTVALLYCPSPSAQQDGTIRNLPVYCTSSLPGSYHICVYQEGKLTSRQAYNLTGAPTSITLPVMREDEVVFIKIEK